MIEGATQTREAQLLASNRHLTLLTRVAQQLIVGDSPEDHLEAAFRAVAEECGAKYYFHYAVDPAAGETLVLQSSAGLDAPHHIAVFHRIAFGQHLCGKVARTRAALTLENVDLLHDEASAGVRAMGIKAYAGLPLQAHGRLFGTIAFATAERARFSASEIELLRTLADQFSASLDRTRLLESLRQSEASYRSALLAGRMGSWETDFFSRTRSWTAEGMALFGLDLPDGRGQVGGEADEFRQALHPADRHLVSALHEMAARQDSFPAEYRVLRPDGTLVWLSGRGMVTARGPDGAAHRLVSIMADITERKAAEEHVRFLMHEVSHRSKNLLAVIQAIASQTARSATSVPDFRDRFTQRLRGIAASHDLLVNENWQGASLGDLVREQLLPFAGPGSPRLVLTGPEVVLNSAAAQSIGLALHELATNAIKYGALSMPDGRILISWRLAERSGEHDGLQIRWEEQGGPPVVASSRKGFGRIVAEDMVARSLDGVVRTDYAAGGLRWELSVPPVNLIRAEGPPREGISSQASSGDGEDYL